MESVGLFLSVGIIAFLVYVVKVHMRLMCHKCVKHYNRLIPIESTYQIPRGHRHRWADRGW